MRETDAHAVEYTTVPLLIRGESGLTRAAPGNRRGSYDICCRCRPTKVVVFAAADKPIGFARVHPEPMATTARAGNLVPDETTYQLAADRCRVTEGD